jgi:glycerophosphoryl diester phosphodiesterase
MEPFAPKPPSERLPYIIAHRGISGKAPENTLAAFDLACTTPGIDMIELDVRLSKDEEVIVLHDRTLQRTSTGNGAARQYTLEELKQFDAGSWFHPSFSRERIPTLSEIFQFIKERRWLNIELKSDYLHREKPLLLERKVMELVDSSHAGRFVLFSSFDHRMVANIKRMNPAAFTGVIYNAYRDLGRLPSKVARRAGASVFVCAKHELTAGMLRDAHQHGLAVYVYTLNSAVNAKKMTELGVDGILSDNADDIVGSVNSRKY